MAVVLPSFCQKLLDDGRLTPPPDPGLYTGVDNVTYQSWAAVSKSWLWHFNEEYGGSPRKFRAEVEQGEDRQTEAMMIGDALDCAVLEPDEFQQRFQVAGPCHAILQSGGRKGEQCGAPGVGLVDSDDGGKEWRCGTHKGKPDSLPAETTYLSEDQMRCVRNMRDSLFDPETNQDAREILLGKGYNQAAIVWDDEQTGIRCKARIDRYTSFQGELVHVDLKKTAKGTAAPLFATQAARLGYFEQAAHYLDGTRHIDRLKGQEPKKRRFGIVVVGENGAFGRHPVEVYWLRDEDLEKARQVRDGLLRTYKACCESDRWPGPQRRARELMMPSWHMDNVTADPAVEEEA